MKTKLAPLSIAAALLMALSAGLYAADPQPSPTPAGDAGKCDDGKCGKGECPYHHHHHDDDDSSVASPTPK